MAPAALAEPAGPTDQLNEATPPAAVASTAQPPRESTVGDGGPPTAPVPQTVGVFDGEAVSGDDESAFTNAPALRGRRVRRRARRVTRVLRRIDLWSVLKLALVLYTCVYAATLAALATIWAAAYSTGLIGKLQSFLGDVGLENFRFYGDQMFRACAAIGAVLVLAATLITVLTVALVNLISELTGGIRIVVIEEEPWPQGRERVAVAQVQPLPSDPAAGL